MAYYNIIVNIIDTGIMVFVKNQIVVEQLKLSIVQNSELCILCIYP